MIFFRAIDLDSPNSLSNQGVLLLFFFPSRHRVNLEFNSKFDNFLSMPQS